jgi:dihydroflavonol-4-reductase
MKTLITGASGFVGSAVLRQLISAGHEVRALVRAGSDHRNLDGIRVEKVIGDLADSASLRRAVQGCSHLFHVAADYRLWIPDPAAMYRTNVEGTTSLLRHAADAGVIKMVYTSSVAALGLTPDGSPADEQTPVDPDRIVGHYKRSKYAAEQAVLQLVAGEKIPVIIVNPSTPVGPRDIKPTPTGRIIVDTLNRQMPAYVDTGLNIVHVDDVAAGHLLAWERGQPGERYILGGENLSLRQMLEEICAIAGLKAPSIRLPHTLVLPIAWCMERWAAVTGQEPRATVDAVRMARKKMYFSSAKASAKLGYHARPSREGLADAIHWFQANGYCKGRKS